MESVVRLGAFFKTGNIKCEEREKTNRMQQLDVYY